MCSLNNIQQIKNSSISIFTCLMFFGSPAHSEEDYRCRTVGSSWVWFEDHIAITVDYATRGPDGRTYEVGTGISVGGSPWGEVVLDFRPVCSLVKMDQDFISGR